MQAISKPVTRKDHAAKVSGQARYLSDMPSDGVYYTKLIRSRKANARIQSIAYPPLPEGYFIADGRDMPVNEAEMYALDAPVFAVERCQYVGEAVAIVAGPNQAVVNRLAENTLIQYTDEKPAVVSVEACDVFFDDVSMQRGDCAEAFADADLIVDDVFTTGRQEQVYLETQSLEARQEDGVLVIEGSMQCPYYIENAIAHAFRLPKEKIRVIQTVTGGGFGGKEEYPSLLACQVAAAAIRSGKPCRIVLDRQEDMSVTTKRHPSRIQYRAAVRDGHVTALDVDIILDGGAYRGLSYVVLLRSMFSVSGVYYIPNLRVRGRAAKTNTPPNGAFRGFGGPQSFFAVEMLMNHIAAKVHKDPIAFKQAHFARQADQTATGGKYHDQVPLPEMLEMALKMSGYREKQAQFDSQEGSVRRGIGASFVFHGCGFTGNGEREVIKASARLQKLEDGSVLIHAANTEMGQGLQTTFPKIVAKVLDIPIDRVTYPLPDTKTALDSGPTVASRSIMIVGKLLERAAQKLKSEWVDGQAQTIDVSYVDPPYLIPFDDETFTGDAYPAYAWSINIVEVEVDCVTAQTRVAGAWAVYDCGVPIDKQILRGQAEGGIVQGIGYASMENMGVRPDGSIAQNSLTDYMIPTAMDVPSIQVAFYETPYEEGPFGARGAGELMVVGVAPAFTAAVENALQTNVQKIPLLPEDIMKIWGDA